MDIEVLGELRLNPAGSTGKHCVAVQLIFGPKQNRSNIIFPLMSHSSLYVTGDVFG